MELKMFALGVVMLFCIVQSSSALKCYSCNSKTNSGCADLTDKSLQLQECTIGRSFELGRQLRLYNLCGKVVVTNGTKSYVERTCLAQRQENEDVCKTVGQYEPNLKFCGACQMDGCNSGNSMQLFAKLIVFCAMVSAVRLLV